MGGDEAATDEATLAVASRVPLRDAALEAEVARLPLIAGEGTWVRTVPADYLSKAPPGSAPGSPPNPLWPGGTYLTEARYIPQGMCNAYHISDGVSTAFAEFEQRKVRESHPVFGVPDTDAVTLRVEWKLDGILDLCDDGVREKLGVDEKALVSLSALLDAIEQTGNPNAETITQAIGRAAFARRDVVAIRYPSARRAGGMNLVVFTDRLVAGGDQFLETRDPARDRWFRIPPTF
jgi:hypothetical protein